MATTHNSPIKGATYIPEEFRCNPYDCSPSGAPFFADKRNVEAVETAFEDDTVISKDEFFASLERGEQAYRDGKCIRMLPGETVEQLLERVRG